MLYVSANLFKKQNKKNYIDSLKQTVMFIIDFCPASKKPLISP